jgi:hypothetical protein
MSSVTAAPALARSHVPSLNPTVLITSVADFFPPLRKLLVNALFWALEEPYLKGQDIEKLLPAAVK